MAYMKKQTPIKKTGGSMKKTVKPLTPKATVNRNQGSGLTKQVTGNTKPVTTNKMSRTQTSLTAPTKQNAQKKKYY